MDAMYIGSKQYLDCLDIEVSKNNVRNALILFLAIIDKSIFMLWLIIKFYYILSIK